MRCYPAVILTVTGQIEALVVAEVFENIVSNMGFYYRKSVSVGPFRVNVSKSGVGYSVGGPGFRTGVSARGKRYSTYSIPGTGVGYRTSGSGSGSGLGCLVVMVVIVALATGIGFFL